MIADRTRWAGDCRRFRWSPAETDCLNCQRRFPSHGCPATTGGRRSSRLEVAWPAVTSRWGAGRDRRVPFVSRVNASGPTLV